MNDAVLAVTATPELQRSRVMAARGWTREQAQRRLSRARSNESFATLADVTIVNDGREAEASAAARDAVARLCAKRTHASRGYPGAIT